MKKQLTLLTAALLLIGFSSCSDEADTTKPIIDLQGPTEGQIFAPGDDIHLEMELSDDIALGSYKIDIHNNFDGHGHSTHSSMAATKATPFSYNHSWSDIAGKLNAHVHHHEIVIATDAEHGDYHFTVYCTDAAGNESQVVRNISIN